MYGLCRPNNNNSILANLNNCVPIASIRYQVFDSQRSDDFLVDYVIIAISTKIIPREKTIIKRPLWISVVLTTAEDVCETHCWNCVVQQI